MGPSEIALRAEVVAEARSWLHTPYVSNGLVKGRRGGTDCAMLLVGVYQNVGLIPKDFDPRPYPANWHLHQNEERYMNTVTQFCHSLAEGRAPQAADLVLFHIGRTFAHGGIITAWPRIVHARAPGAVLEDDVLRNNTGKHALSNMTMRFFTYWSEP